MGEGGLISEAAFMWGLPTPPKFGNGITEKSHRIWPRDSLLKLKVIKFFYDYGLISIDWRTNDMNPPGGIDMRVKT